MKALKEIEEVLLMADTRIDLGHGHKGVASQTPGLQLYQQM